MVGNKDVRRILIYRLGSLGDTVVTLPVFHLLARDFPDAERRVLTNVPESSAAPAMQAVLGDGGLVHGYFAYPLGVRSPRKLWTLLAEIRRWRPQLAIYLNIPHGYFSTMRDAAFLKLCGASRTVGISEALELRRSPIDARTGFSISEYVRVARCVAALGDAAPDEPANWDMRFTLAEEAEAERALSGWPGAEAFLAFCPGTKWPINDWGDERWSAVLAQVSAACPRLGLTFLGAADDRARSDLLARGWAGPTINLCGTTSPRVSALIIRQAAIFAGNDSGPMHLAEAVGTPAAIVFSNLRRPGRWFPFGAHHRVFYPGLDWSGGQPPVMRDARNETDMNSIPPDQVAAACIELLRGADTTGQ